jgi:preprotein translocase subunit SecB
LANEKTSLTADEIRRMLKGLKLVNVALVNCDAKADRALAMSTFSKTTTVPVKITETSTFEETERSIIIRHNYRVSVKSKSKNLFNLKADFDVIMEASEGFSEEFFEAFQSTTLRLITWPYLRELVASLTARMDLPKLQLGLWHVPFA